MSTVLGGDYTSPGMLGGAEASWYSGLSPYNADNVFRSNRLPMDMPNMGSSLGWTGVECHQYRASLDCLRPSH
jgi:hypothetical protein